VRFSSARERAEYLQQQAPLVDGHNDLPWALHNLFNNNLSALNLSVMQPGSPFHRWLLRSSFIPAADDDDGALTLLCLFATPSELMTDLPRLRDGFVGGQFWSVYVQCGPGGYNGSAAVQATMDQIDVVYRLTEVPLSIHPMLILMSGGDGDGDSCIRKT